MRKPFVQVPAPLRCGLPLVRTEAGAMNSDLADLSDIAAGLTDLYKDLHAHPELSFAERRTADVAATRLSALGYAIHNGIGGAGLVGVHAGAAFAAADSFDVRFVATLEWLG